MKFRVERDVLAEAVTWVARGLPARPPVPVLAGVLIEAGAEGTLTLSSFDYEVSGRITVPADVEEPGTVLVLGRLLADISRNLPNRPVDVVTEGAKVQVICGSSRFALLQMPADEYPTLPTSPEGSGSIDGTVFNPAWGGIGDTWFNITATGGDSFSHIVIAGMGFFPETFVDNLSWNTVPAPGAIALLGLGLVRGRRRSA